MRIQVRPFVFAPIVILLGAIWSFALGADALPVATPAATADEYLAHPDAARSAGMGASESLLKSLTADWKKVLVGGALIALTALLGTAKYIPIGGPWGALAEATLRVVSNAMRSKIMKLEQVEAAHQSEAFQTIATTIQTLGNTQTVGDIKRRLLIHAPDHVVATIDRFVGELEAQGINHPPSPRPSDPPQLSPAG